MSSNICPPHPFFAHIFEKNIKFVLKQISIFCLFLFYIHQYSFLYFISQQMGSSYSKDQNIDLYLNTNKQFYIAGQCVEGQVYLNAKTTRPYSNICIKVTGIQYVYWSTGSGKNRRSHSNTYKSYDHHVLLVDFHGTVNQGQYMFPFSLQLPTMMSGSFYYSSCCYIKYVLTTQLVHMTEENNSQRFQMFLNIIQPPRMQLSPVSMANSVHSQCCGCCTDYGTVSVSVSCDKNFVINGSPVQIKGFVNNSQGKDIIKEWKILLQERKTMISSGGRVRNDVINSYVMHQGQNTGPIPAGGTQQFNFANVIPHNIVNYTAIGKVVARFFLLSLQTDYGCCTSPAGAVVHLIVHSQTPMIVQKKTMPPPPNWNPTIYQKISCTDMKPYIYNPLPQLGFLNMPGNNNIVMGNQMGNQSLEQLDIYNQTPHMNYSDKFNAPNVEERFKNYTPTFYNTDLFSQAERQQQGYQPYFGKQNNQDHIIRKL